MTETTNVYEIRLGVCDVSVRLFRNNNGAYKDRDGNWITYGLGVGTSDLIGWKTVVVTPDMVGKHIPVFVGIEVKTKDGKTEKRRLQAQRDFINLIHGHGGMAGFAVTVDDARNILNQSPGVVHFPPYGKKTETT